MCAFKVGDLVQVDGRFFGEIKLIRKAKMVRDADRVMVASEIGRAWFYASELKLVCTGCRGLGEGAPMDDGTVTKCPRCDGSKLEPDEEG